MKQGSIALGSRVSIVIATLALVLLALPTVSPAQTPDQRRALDAFRERVLAETDSILLRRMESELLEEVRRKRNDAALHIRLGFLSLQRGDIGAASHYDDAASEFKWATQISSDWPYAWYALGEAEFALGARMGGDQSDPPIPAQEAWLRAAQAFAHAAGLEPGFAPRLEELARRASRDHTPGRAAVVRDALRRSVIEARGPRGARLLLALGRVQREMGDSEALASFEGYFASGENRGLALLELGRTRLWLGDLDGAALYYEGVATDDPVAVAEARADLAPIVNEGDLADFDLRRETSRAAMVRRFWTMRDRVEFRAEGERLAEHLRRLSVARREFLLVLAGGIERFDDRGRILVRHGEPDDRASFTLPGVEPNESWRYRRGGPDMLFHFAARQAPNDFRLVESVLDVSDVRAGLQQSTPAAAASAHVTNGEQLLRSRSALAPLYGRSPGTRPDQVADFLAEERALGRRSIQVGTRSDSYALRFVQSLDAWGQVVVAGGSWSQPELQVLFAIPGYALEPASGAVGVVYPVRVGFVALDSTGTIVAAIDSITRIEPAERIPANRSLVGRVTVPVRPGRLTIQAAVQYGERAGTAFGVDTVVIPAPMGGPLAMGSLLIGSRRGRLTVRFGDGQDVPVSPGGVVQRSDGLELAVELFGLGPSDVATVQVLVAPDNAYDSGLGALPQWKPFPERRGEGRVSRVAGGGAIARWRTSLPLTRLKPGSWLLAVVATDASGREVRQEGRLEVLMP